ncbi:MAG: hypothetical protein FJ146_12850 [Deltaproteobacteria bacterium]|nr:hypothetical protein [Deltaproteobacteria bacterium]
MSFDQPIDAVRNRKNLKLFIVIDDSLDFRYKVINPSGEVLILPDLLFEDDPIIVAPEDASTEFSPEQLSAYSEHLVKAAAAAAAAKLAASRPEPPRRIVAEPAPRPKTRRQQSTPIQTRRGLAASWSAPRLTFYKHKIEPLHPKQSFKITVEGTGDFEITKEDFVAHFNDVMMSPSYRADGLFTYPQIPDKALRYRKA